MLSAKLELRQSQSLVITPQLQQAIKLLQLSNLELQSFLEHEIEQNPLLEWSERSNADGASANGDAAANSENAAGSPEQPVSNESGDTTQHDELADYGDDAQPSMPGAYETLSFRTATGRSLDDAAPSVEDYIAQQTSLRDHLRQQLHLAIIEPDRRLIGDHLIDFVDDSGYLRDDVAEVAERLGAPLSMVESVLAVIQTFEPSGVAARSLAECLVIQLKEQNRYDPVIAKLLENLDLIAAHDLARLRRICGVDQDELAEMIAEIRSLNPKPGLQFASGNIQTVVPDIVVTSNGAGGWIIQLNSETLPQIRVNHSFYASVKRTIRNEKDKAYLQGCMSTANWLARSLDQRRQTMLKVGREIVRQQEGFFTQGVRGLKPLGLKDVADKIGMHESTVSRVTSNKYMQTPRGTFELKYFFTSSIPAAGYGEAHSSEAVKYRIREMIDNESARRILSDDKIVDLLRSDGIDIARRTVAKYRELMRIPSSVQRRRNKNSVCVVKNVN